MQDLRQARKAREKVKRVRGAPDTYIGSMEKVGKDIEAWWDKLTRTYSSSSELIAAVILLSIFVCNLVHVSFMWHFLYLHSRSFT